MNRHEGEDTQKDEQRASPRLYHEAPRFILRVVLVIGKSRLTDNPAMASAGWVVAPPADKSNPTGLLHGLHAAIDQSPGDIAWRVFASDLAEGAVVGRMAVVGFQEAADGVVEGGVVLHGVGRT